jgi:ribonuclease HI
MVTLAERYRIQLVWVPRHKGIDGNEIAGELAKGASHSLTEPGPVLCIPADIGRDVIRN